MKCVEFSHHLLRAKSLTTGSFAEGVSQVSAKDGLFLEGAFKEKMQDLYQSCIDNKHILIRVVKPQKDDVDIPLYMSCYDNQHQKVLFVVNKYEMKSTRSHYGRPSIEPWCE